jgi:cathepsin B
MRLFLVLLLVAAACALSRLDAPAVTQEMIDSINNDPTSTWKAGWNKKFERATLAEAKKWCGALPAPRGFEVEVRGAVAEALPDSFDARTQWPDCKRIGHIRDQSACGSCWAFGAVEAFEDRMCIFGNGQYNDLLLSPLDMVACCDECGMGCNGGFLAGAWNYIRNPGLVSGGDYGDTATCAPYPLPPCDHHVNGTLPPCGNIVPTPSCVQKCQVNYPKQWVQDKHHSKSAYQVASNQQAIMTEIMTNGPVEVSFTVYSDFLTYKSGVYQHKSGSQVGGHAVKMLGWGTEGGKPYWLIANSWNNEWGDNGYFKILRGSNECRVESDVHGGIPA